MKNLWRGALTLVMVGLFVLIIVPGTALALVDKEPPKFIDIIVPDRAQAGSAVTVVVLATDIPAGLFGGEVELKGPSGQRLTADLRPDGSTGRLQATFSLSSYLESGTWTVSRVQIRDNEKNLTEVYGGEAFVRPIVVSGGTADVTPPVIDRVSLGAGQVAGGDLLSVKADVRDNLSGVARVTALFASPSDYANTSLVPVKLKQNPATGGWEGYTPAPFRTSDGKWQLKGLQVSDRAGNIRTRDMTAQAGLTVTIRPRQPRAGLTASDQLRSFVPAPLPFMEWYRQDLAHLEELHRRLPTNPREVRDQLTAELTELSRVLEEIRAEVYVHPTLKFRISVPATSGKWLVTSLAIQARELLWLTANDPSQRNLQWNTIRSFYDPGAALNYPMEPIPAWIYNDYGSAVADGLAWAMETSRLPAEVYSAPHLDNDFYNLDYLDDLTIYVMPFSLPDASAFHGAEELDIVVGMNEGILETDVTYLYDTLIHELGHHIHDSFVSGDYFLNPAPWDRYLQLRGGYTWPKTEVGHDAQPIEIFAEDVKMVFSNPLIVDQMSHDGAWGNILDDPQMAARFESFVRDSVARAGSRGLSVASPGAEFITSPGPRIVIEGNTDPNVPVLMWVLPRTREWILQARDLEEPLTEYEVRSDSQGRFRSLVNLPGPGLYTIQVYSAVGPDGLPHQEWLSVLYPGQGNGASGNGAPGPVLTVTVPSAINQTSFWVLGQTAPGTTVSINGVLAFVDQKGSFSATVTLPSEGRNRVLVEAWDAAGNTTTVEKEVIVDLTAPFGTIKYPVTTNQAQVELTGQTEPGALVTVGVQQTVAGPDGSFRISVGLGMGNNRFTAIFSDAVGNSFKQDFTITRKDREKIIKLVIGQKTAVVDGQSRTMDVAPQIFQDRSFVPLRFIGEALGAEVDWRPVTSTAVYRLDGVEVLISIGSYTALVNGKPKVLETPARLVQSRTLVPLRFILENLGARVDYDQATRTIIITR